MWGMKKEKSEEFKECPVCKERTFKYDTELGANRCHNEFCGWRDKVAPAIDVPMQFLELCYEKAEPGPKKELVRKIIEATKKVNAEVGLSVRS